MLRNKMSKILESPTKEINRAWGQNGVLSRLFRQMLKNLNITNYNWEGYMADFLRDVGARSQKDSRTKTSMRGNLTKEFQKEQMTWKVFCKAVRFLQVMRFELTLTAYHSDGRVTIHKTDVNFGERRDTKRLVEELDTKEADEHDEQESEFEGPEVEDPEVILQRQHDEFNREQQRLRDAQSKDGEGKKNVQQNETLAQQ